MFSLPPSGSSMNSLGSSFLPSLKQLSHSCINKSMRTIDPWIHYSSNIHLYSCPPTNIVLKIALNNSRGYRGIKDMQ